MRAIVIVLILAACHACGVAHADDLTERLEQAEKLYLASIKPFCVGVPAGYCTLVVDSAMQALAVQRVYCPKVHSVTLATDGSGAAFVTCVAYNRPVQYVLVHGRLYK